MARAQEFQSVRLRNAKNLGCAPPTSRDPSTSVGMTDKAFAPSRPNQDLQLSTSWRQLKIRHRLVIVQCRQQGGFLGTAKSLDKR